MGSWDATRSAIGRPHPLLLPLLLRLLAELPGALCSCSHCPHDSAPHARLLQHVEASDGGASWRGHTVLEHGRVLQEDKQVHGRQGSELETQKAW